MAAPVGASLPDGPFPLGRGHLIETRTADPLAPGLVAYTIVRSGDHAAAEWRISAGVARNEGERRAAAGCLSRLGLAPVFVPYRTPGRGGRYVEVVGGTFADEKAAVAAAARAARGCDLTAQSVAASPRQSDGPWRLHIVEIQPQHFHGRLEAVLGKDTVAGREAPSAIAHRTHALIAINGGFFVMGASDGVVGEPAGLSVIDGKIKSEPTAGRPYLLLTDGARVGARIVTAPPAPATVRWGDGSTARIDGVDRRPGEVRNCGTATAGTAHRPAQDQTCRVADDLVAITADAGFVPDIRDARSILITRDNRVAAARSPRSGETLLVAIGKAADRLAAKVRSNTRAAVDLAYSVPAGTSSRHTYAVNGGPLLLHKGKPVRDDDREGWSMAEVTRDRADFVHDWTMLRNPRTAVGVGADGTIWLVVADGREFAEASSATSSSSVGLSIEELRSVMAHLGAADAINLDGGGSSALVVGGRLVTHPSDRSGERAVGDAIVVTP